MRVFVAGASGAIGRPLVPKLVAAGHEVTGMTRSQASAEAIRAAGAQAAVVDAFDAEALSAAVQDAGAEAVVHQLTALPERFDFKDPKLYDATNRLRGEGTRNLLAAARAAGAHRFVSQSIAFMYAPSRRHGEDGGGPADRGGPGAFAGGLRALAEMERAVLDADGFVLRYGFFYGPGTYYAAEGSATADIRRRRLPVVGKGAGVTSFVHVDDAADATVAAVERGAPGVYNIADDEPAPMKEWVPVFAAAAGAKRPLRVPAWVARLVAGKAVTMFALESRGVSNAKAKRELGWAPAHPSWRTGFAESFR